jgi:hypothetical protein
MVKLKKNKTQRKKTQKGGYVIDKIDRAPSKARVGRSRSRSRSRSRTSSANRGNKDYKP